MCVASDPMWTTCSTSQAVYAMNVVSVTMCAISGFASRVRQVSGPHEGKTRAFSALCVSSHVDDP